LNNNTPGRRIESIPADLSVGGNAEDEILGSHISALGRSMLPWHPAFPASNWMAQATPDLAADVEHDHLRGVDTEVALHFQGRRQAAQLLRLYPA